MVKIKVKHLRLVKKCLQLQWGSQVLDDANNSDAVIKSVKISPGMGVNMRVTNVISVI